MKLVILFLILCLWAAVAAAEPINCNQFWSQAASEPPLQCELHTRTGFPRTIAGAEVRIYHYSDGWTDETGQLDLLASVSEAIEDAVPAYARSAAVPPIYFVLYDEINDRSFAEADWTLPGSREPCRVRLYFNIPNDRNLARQIVAHEIFHCVQRYGIVPITSEEPAGTLLSSRWWVEGSADFASSHVIPTGKGETFNSGAYRPSLPLYRQPNSYSTSIFFFASDLPTHGIVQLLRAQPAQSTFAGERRALAAGGQAGDLFHKFAKRLIDKDIRGGGGKALPLPEVPPGEPFEVDDETPHVGLSVTPFTIQRSRLKFHAGVLDELKLDNDADGKLLVSIRKVGDTAWTRLSPGNPFVVDVACNDEAGQEYDIVYTSHADQEDAVQFSVQIAPQGGEPRACPCEGTARPIDRCLLGHWRLDNESYKAWMQRTLARGFSRVDVTGTYDFDFRRPRKAQAAYSQFHTSLFIPTDAGDQPWIETNANGTIDYQAVKTKPGKMCFTQTAASGTYRYTVGGQGEEGPLSDMVGGGGQSVELSYLCRGRSLRIWSEEGEHMIEWTFVKQ